VDAEFVPEGGDSEFVVRKGFVVGCPAAVAYVRAAFRADTDLYLVGN